MGAFVLITDKAKPDLETVAASANQSLIRQGFAEPTALRFEHGVLLLYAKQVAPIANLVTLSKGDFSAATGSFVYKGATGKTGLAAIHADFDITSKQSDFGIDLDRLHGAFCMVLRKHGRTFAFIDRVGVYKVYRDSSETLLSSSFLAVLESASKRRADRQCVYEYVFQGGTYGDDTLADDIKLVSADRLIEPGVTFTAGKWSALGTPDITHESMEWHAEQVAATLKRGFGEIVNAYDGHIDTALSGGYDSRLILALLFNRKCRPDIHVYGKDSDPDVIVAKRIAEGEGFPLKHIDKGTATELPIEQAAESVSRTFNAFDGAPTDGIFDNGTDLATRRDRCRTGALMLNGGGGEVFRNFFYLPDRTFTVQDILWSFYSQFDPAAAGETFDEDAYHARLGDKIKATIGTTKDRLTRPEVELVYPLFRCRYWMGRNNAVNSRFGSALTPFIDAALIRQTARVPLKYKNVGRFEGRLITLASPALASYPSDYGYAFDRNPPLSARLKAMTTYMRPPSVRRLTFRLRTRRQTVSRPYFLDDAFRDAVMESGFPRLGNLFHPEKLPDTGQFNRLCTAEYLFQKMDMAIGD